MRIFIIMLGLGMALLASQARAAATDALIEGAKLCTRHLPRYEREFGIPTHLLSAIASTESGRYHEGLGIKVPWPWTINADGKGYIYDSKAEAIAAVRKLKAHGVQSIDVGCMQVNLYHHPDAFASLEEAFEPEKNIAYAAGFLRGLYQEDGSWKQAAADYHSKTPKLGKEYVGLVYNSWYQIIDKLRAARMQVPESSVTAMNELKSGPYGAPPVRASITRLPGQDGRKTAAYQPVRMNSIQVSKQENAHDNGIIVVHPDIKVVDNAPSPVAVASAESSPLITVTPQEAPDAKIIRVGDQRVVETTTAGSKKSGPNFIFND